MYRFRVLFVFILILLVAAACGGDGEASRTLHIGLTDDAAAAGAALLACIPQDEGIDVQIEPADASITSLDDFDLLIRLGDPEEVGFAAQIAADRIVLVLNLDNPVQNLTRSHTADIFAGRLDNWAELGGDEEELTAWIGLEGQEARVLFEREVLGGLIGGNTRLAGSPQQMLAAVAGDPGAVGVLPAALADEGVTIVDLGLVTPVLVLAKEEPEGPARQVLACLQTGLGRDILKQQYPRMEAEE
jgi:hypothetical protein